MEPTVWRRVRAPSPPPRPRRARSSPRCVAFERMPCSKRTQASLDAAIRRHIRRLDRFDQLCGRVLEVAVVAELLPLPLVLVQHLHGPRECDSLPRRPQNYLLSILAGKVQDRRSACIPRRRGPSAGEELVCSILSNTLVFTALGEEPRGVTGLALACTVNELVWTPCASRAERGCPKKVL